MRQAYQAARRGQQATFVVGWLVLQNLMTIMVPVLVPPVAVGRRPTLVEPVAATEVARMGVSQLWATLLPAGANVASFRDRLLQPG